MALKDQDKRIALFKTSFGIFFRNPILWKLNFWTKQWAGFFWLRDLLQSGKWHWLVVRKGDPEFGFDGIKNRLGWRWKKAV